ncbi:F0F1 ATP synthase subunit delta [Candidatus Daviesbacteria bacterium]|nr:F0F1 ATP synthase subunit delta [Candidatus Daviesbacteria bacterium]
MKINKQLRKTVDKLVEESFAPSGQVVEKKVRLYIKALKNLPLPKAIATLTFYKTGLKRDLQKSILEIETSTPLSKVQINQITKSFKNYHTVSSVQTTLNKQLLGGLKVRLGDMVFDDTIDQKIKQLKGVIYG